MNGQHSRALDGLRWFSFLGVFLYHADESLFRVGRYGVQVFFVLSGFLIGGILLSLRDQVQIPLRERLKTFYIRRSLRIFPLYYFVLAVIALLGSLHLMNGHLRVLPLHALYLSNFYLALTGAKLDSQTHLWSLCVEEHFYLIAPLLLLRAGYRQLGIGFALLFLLVALARTCNYFFWGNPRFEYLSPIQFDILVSGVIAAIVLRSGTFMGLTEESVRRLGLTCGLACLAMLIWMYFPSSPESFAEAVILPPVMAVATGALVLTLWTGGLPLVRQLCSLPPFVYLGRISYGLYIYHYLIFFVFTRYSTGTERVLRVTACLLATIVIASLSWYFLEKPFLSLKRRYAYGQRSATSAQTEILVVAVLAEPTKAITHAVRPRERRAHVISQQVEGDLSEHQ
jgi:peptidoglycan/LPS O-acetylase OafA/YrhL